MNVLKSLLSAIKNNNVLSYRAGFIKNGYIKVNIEGSIPEGISLNESFIVDRYFKKYYYSCNRFEICNDQVNVISFMISRISDKKETKTASLYFTLNGDTVSNASIEISIIKKLKNNEESMTIFNLGYDKNPFTNIKYDYKNQEVSGEFNSLVYGSSIIKIFGDFKLKLTEANYLFKESTTNEEEII